MALLHQKAAAEMEKVIHIFDIDPKFTNKMLTNEVAEKFSGEYELKFPKFTLDGDRYFCGSAFLSFSDKLAAAAFNAAIKTAQHPFSVEYQSDCDAASLRLIVIGLNRTATANDVMRLFRRYRAQRACVWPSETAQHAAAAVEFASIHDRDLALLRAQLPRGAVAHLPLLPNGKLVKVSALPPKDGSASVGDVEFRHRGRTYICARRNVEAVCKEFSAPVCEIPYEFCGDFELIISYINGKTVDIKDENVIFCYQVGYCLGMEHFISQIPFIDFVNLNNVIVFANFLDQYIDDSNPIFTFLDKNSKTLFHDKRFKLLTKRGIEILFKNIDCDSPNVCNLFLQTANMDIDRTQIFKKIDLKNIYKDQFVFLLKEKNINFNECRDDILTVLQKYESFSCSEFVFQNDPFDGIINKFRLEANGNTLSEYISLQASSTGFNHMAENILSTDPNLFFSSKELPNQWVTFQFKKHSIRLTGYTYGTHNTDGNGHSKAWEISGSNDNNNWVKIHEVYDIADLKTKKHLTFNVVSSEYYKFIRIMNKDINTSGFHILRIGGFEFFGNLRKDICD